MQIKYNKKIVRDYVNLFGKNIKIKYGKEFESDILTKTIYLGKTIDIHFAFDYLNYYNQKDKDIVSMFILHEIGHIMTTTEQEFHQDLELTSIYNFLHYKNIIASNDKLTNLYFNIPAEQKATEWAIAHYVRLNDKGAAIG